MNNAKDIAFASAKGITKNFIKRVPIFGTVVDIYQEYAALLTQRKFKRLEDFYRALNEEVQNININKDYIRKEDFLDVFERTARYVVNERCEKKRLLFKNILLHSVSVDNCSYDKTESYMRLLEQLNLLSINIIAILHNPIEYNKKNGMIIADLPAVHVGPGMHYILKYDFVEQLQLLLKLKSKDDILEELYFLEVNRIIYSGVKNRVIETNVNPVQVLENSLTKKGEDFFSFLVN